MSAHLLPPLGPWTRSEAPAARSPPFGRVQCRCPRNPAHSCSWALLAPDISHPGLIFKAPVLPARCLLWAGAPAGQMWASHGHLANATTPRKAPLVASPESWWEVEAPSREFTSVLANSLRAPYLPNPEKGRRAFPRSMHAVGW